MASEFSSEIVGVGRQITPAPLLPPNCDLRDFPFMPVDIARLFGSEFHALSDDAAWRAGVTLWLRSYHQVPAASLPDDDVALARLAELGRDLRTWRKIKSSALRGWIKCSDGRLYHKVVAEKALEGWLEKLLQRKSSAAGNAKRYNYEFDATEHDQAIEDAAGMLAAINPQSRSLSHKRPTGTPGGTKIQTKKPPGGSPDSLPPGSQGKGREGKKEKNSDLRSAAGAPPEPMDEDAKKVLFSSGLKWLADKSKKPEDAVRPLLGRMLSDIGGDPYASVLLGIFRDAKREGKADPIGWIQAMIQGRRARAGPQKSNGAFEAARWFLGEGDERAGSEKSDIGADQLPV